MKERAYFEDHDRSVIKKWAEMIKSDTGLILKKLNSERRISGKPTFRLKALIDEIRRGGGDDCTGSGYNPEKAKKAYRIGKNKDLHWFDERSAFVLRWFLDGCHMSCQESYLQYKLLRKHGCDIVKLHKVADIEWLMRHGYLEKRINDQLTFSGMPFYLVQHEDTVCSADRKWAMVYWYLKENPAEGKYVIFGEAPEDYMAVDEATGKPAEQQSSESISDHTKEEVKKEPSKEIVSEDVFDDNDVTTINIVGNGRVRIINTSPNAEYQITRKGNEWIIMM